MPPPVKKSKKFSSQKTVFKRGAYQIIPTSKKEAMQQASLQAAEIGMQFIAAPSSELNLKLVEPKH